MQVGSYFEITQHEPSAQVRLGVLHTAHGALETPAFLPLASQGSVPSLTPDDLVHIGVQALSADAFHLACRPGVSTIAALGGLHRFMGWSGILFTYFRDTWGDYDDRDRGILNGSGIESRRSHLQVAHRPRTLRVSDEALVLTSYVDGSPMRITPEHALETQRLLGADGVCALGIPLLASAERNRSSRTMRLATEWSGRTMAIPRWAQELRFADLRAFVSLGNGSFPHEEQYDGYSFGPGRWGDERVLNDARLASSCLPPGSPRHACAVRGPLDFAFAAAAGLDLIDSEAPMLDARRAILYTAQGPLVLSDPRFREEFEPIEVSCTCPACTGFSRAYLHSLFVAEELLGSHLATLHNLAFMVRLGAEVREAIAARMLDSTLRNLTRNWWAEG